MNDYARQAFEEARRRADEARKNKEPVDFEELDLGHPAWRPFTGELLLLDRHYVTVTGTGTEGFKWKLSTKYPSLTSHAPRAKTGSLAWSERRRGFLPDGWYTAQGLLDECMMMCGRPLDGDVLEIDGARGCVLQTDMERLVWVPLVVEHYCDNDPAEVLGEPRELAWDDLWHPLGELGWKTRAEANPAESES